MALDAATLALCARELKTLLADCRIDKIYQPSKEEIVLNMRSRKGTFRLLLSARTGSARVCVTNEVYENPETPPSYCMLLRKHLIGGRLEDVFTPESERILFFTFRCTNEMGDSVCNTLAAELMGRYCNLVLFNQENKILDALKRVDFSDSQVRQLLPGLTYSLPLPQNKLDVLSAPVEEILERLEKDNLPVSEGLRLAAGGVGPVVIREILYRAFGATPPIEKLSEQEKKRLEQAIDEIRRDFSSGGQPNLVRKPDGIPFEFSFTPLTQYGEVCKPESYHDFSHLLEAYYGEKSRLERMAQKSKEIRRTAQNLYDRAVRKQAARIEDLEKSKASEQLRLKGELLTANLHSFKRGDTGVTLTNWMDGQQLYIPLDARLAPAANAQKYFKEYKKQQTAAKMLHTLLETGKKEIAYLETVLYELDSATGEAALADIREELKESGYLKQTVKRQKRHKPQGFLRYISSDGFVILVGRNNMQNDKLTLKTARGKDLWFHTRNAPGSHVVVMSEGQEIPVATQNEAAMLAVAHSSQKNSVKVAVDYTPVKNIRKTGDLPLGMVLYDHYKTAYVTPDAAVLERLEKKNESE